MNHSFNVKVAQKYGTNVAIFLENLQWWTLKNIANGRHFYDGRHWSYNTVKAFSRLFPYWSEKQVRSTIEKAINEDLIISGNYNKAGFDHTKWYAFTEKGAALYPDANLLPKEGIKNDGESIYTASALICPKRQIGFPKKANRVSQKGNAIPDINTDINTKKQSYIDHTNHTDLEYGDDQKLYSKTEPFNPIETPRNETPTDLEPPFTQWLPEHRTFTKIPITRPSEPNKLSNALKALCIQNQKQEPESENEKPIQKIESIPLNEKPVMVNLPSLGKTNEGKKMIDPNFRHIEAYYTLPMEPNVQTTNETQPVKNEIVSYEQNKNTNQNPVKKTHAPNEIRRAFTINQMMIRQQTHAIYKVNPDQVKDFETFWSLYPLKTNKEGVEALWFANGCHTIAKDIIRNLEVQIKRDKRFKGNFVRNPKNYILQHGWNDPIFEDKKEKGWFDYTDKSWAKKMDIFDLMD